MSLCDVGRPCLWFCGMTDDDIALGTRQNLGGPNFQDYARALNYCSEQCRARGMTREWKSRVPCGKTLGPFETREESEEMAALHVKASDCCRNRRPACDCSAMGHEGDVQEGLGRNLNLATDDAVFDDIIDSTSYSSATWMAILEQHAAREGLQKSMAAKMAKAKACWASEQGPSAVAAASGKQRDTFSDLCDEWDLLPDAGR